MIAHQGAQSSRMTFQDAVDKPMELTREYPMSSMLVIFGVGVGVGLVLSQAIAAPLGHMMQPEPTMTEKLGQRVMEAIRPMVPDSIARSCNWS
jgi:hypothetical protein